MKTTDTIEVLLDESDYIGTNVRGKRLDADTLLLVVDLTGRSPSSTDKETLLASAGRQPLIGGTPDGLIPESGRVTVLVSATTPEQAARKAERSRANKRSQIATDAAAAVASAAGSID